MNVFFENGLSIGVQCSTSMAFNTERNEKTSLLSLKLCSILLIFIKIRFSEQRVSVCSQHKTILNQTLSGIISDGKGPYFSNQRCEWLIASPSAKTHPFISLSFLSRSTECMFDYINIYDGGSYSSPLVATFSGNATLTQTALATSGKMLVYLFSDSNYTLPGFEAAYLITTCPNNCSNHGRCVEKRCECDYNWSGDDCSQPACPYDCMNPDNGLCLFEETYTKKCECKAGFIGLGCGMDTRAEFPSQISSTGGGWWTMVYNYTGESGSEPRAAHAGVFVDPYYYTFGGYNLNRPIGDLLRFNFQRNDWLLYTFTFQPSPRYFHTLSSLQDGNENFLLLYGGDLGNDSLSNELWSYHINSATWKKHSHNKPYPIALCQHTSIVVNINGDKYLYVYGGRTNNSDDDGLSDKMYRFNWKQDSWEEIIPDASGVKSSRLRVAGHSMVYNKLDHSLVVYGGFRMDERQKSFRSSAIYIYDLARNVWIDLQPTMQVHPGYGFLVLPKLAFHQAVVVGDYMVVHGGNVHVHQINEQCYGVYIYFYHLKCHTWTLLLSTDIEYHPQSVTDMGRFAHVATLMHDRVLIVHGGYSGMMTHNILAFRLPNFVIQSPQNATQIYEMCKSIFYKESCNRHPYCIWCDSLPSVLATTKCTPVNEAPRTCARKLSDKCPGICPLLKTCSACAGHSSMYLNSTYGWLQEQCHWCVQDASCHRSSLPPDGLCGARKFSYSHSDPWWGRGNAYVATKMEVCLEKNTPPGAIASEHYPNPDPQQPDRVFLIQEDIHYVRNIRTIDKYNTLKKYYTGEKHKIQIRGFLHPEKVSFSQDGRLQLRLISTNGELRLFLSADDDPSKAQFIASVRQSGSSIESDSPILHPVQKDDRYYFNLTYTHTQSTTSNEWSGNFQLQWNGRYNQDRAKQFQSLFTDFVEAFQSTNCGEYTNCLACLTDMGCGWCQRIGVCLGRKAYARQTNSFCAETVSSQLSAGVILEPSSCWTCPDHATCHKCNADAMCHWHNDKCVRKSSLGRSVVQTKNCDDVCSSKSTCKECLSGKSTACSWCETTQKCYRFSGYHMTAYPFGQCAFWVDMVSQCVDCAKYSTCATCLQSYKCGWCSNVDNPLQGFCTAGEFSGPLNTATCQVESATSGTIVKQWDYSQCPDVDECVTEWPIGNKLHNCHIRADCVNTEGSYACECKRGFAGNGTHCEQTCNITCVHGKCSGYPDYKCICDIGWTSETNDKSIRACDIGCGCNFHSTCSKRAGLCDKCLHNTTGIFCENCLPGYYYEHITGINQRSQHCLPCNCNGHGDKTKNLCDQVTGECFCLHHTTGWSCEICQNGFYGNARNGGTCFRQCNGRTLLTELEGAFGVMDISSMPDEPLSKHRWDRTNVRKLYCQWWINTNSIVKLTIGKGLHIPCMSSQLLVYNGIYNASSANNTLLGSFCGSNWKRNAFVKSLSSSISVLYQELMPSNPLWMKSAFNITYTSTRRCDNNQTNACNEGIIVNNKCPADCVWADKDQICTEESCNCLPGYKASDCQAKTNQNRALKFNYHGQDLENTMVLARYGHTMNSYDNNLFIFGGISPNNGVFGDILRYSLASKAWTEVKVANKNVSAPEPRYLHTTVVRVLDGMMLVFGGAMTQQSNSIWSVQLEDVLQDSEMVWTEYFMDDEIPALAGHTCTLCNDNNNVAYVIGGYSERYGYNTIVWQFDLINIKLTAMSVNNFNAPLVYGHSAVCDAERKIIYVFGGFHNNVLQYPSASNALYEYNLLSDTWTKVYSSDTKAPRPQPLAFHAAAIFSNGYNDGMIIFGGLSQDLQTHGRIWLYRFKCNMWTDLSQLGGDEKEYLIGAYTALASYNSDIFIHGGFQDGGAQDALIEISEIDICRCATTFETCEQLQAGCSYCEQATGNAICYKDNIVVCNGTQHKFIQMCEENHAMDCTEIRSCSECLSPKSALTGLKECKLCHNNQCVSATNTSCSSVTSDSCDVNLCADLSCTACAKQKDCSWIDYKEMDLKYHVLSYTWGCYKSVAEEESSDDEPLVTVAASIPMKHGGGTCRSECNKYFSCEMCVQSHDTGVWQDCIWNEKYQRCFDPDFAFLIFPRGIDGGRMIFQGAESCPLPLCDMITYCGTCVENPKCVWLQHQDDMENGRGNCVQGSSQGPSNEYPDDITKWWWEGCPAENECLNDRHNCLDNSVDREKCRDTEASFECVCQSGFARQGPLDTCLPVCSSGCHFGNCVAPDICECNFGYVGVDCSVPCECNGHSRCENVQNVDVCIQCMNNTTGAQCQFCTVGFVGDPTKNIVCKPCDVNCNMRSTQCVPSSAIGSDHGPKPSEVRCQNCTGNSEGQFCERCREGYFMFNEKCRTCECNGHGTTCNHENGAFCNCQNHTMSSLKQCNDKTLLHRNSYPNQCWKYQCDACMDGFTGKPQNGGHCFRQVLMNQEWCFNPSSQANCLSADFANELQFKTHDDMALPAGQVILFSLQPKFMNVDMRLIIDVTFGEVDVFLTSHPDALSIITDSETGLQYVDMMKLGNRSRRNIPEDLIVTEIEEVGEIIYESDKADLHSYDEISSFITEIFQARELNSYVSLSPQSVLHVKSAHNRIILTIPYKHFNLIETRFYMAVLGKRYEKLIQHTNADQNTGVIMQSIIIDKSRGRIFFRQDQIRMDLFVFFSVFFSCFFLFLTLSIGAWKLKHTMDNRYARQNNIIELQNMASRPFASVLIFLEARPSVKKITKPIVLNSKPPKPPRTKKNIMKTFDKNNSNNELIKKESPRKANLYRSASSSFIPVGKVEEISSPNMVPYEPYEKDLPQSTMQIHPFSISEQNIVSNAESDEVAGPSSMLKTPKQLPSIMKNSTSNITGKSVSFAKHVSILNEAEHLESLNREFISRPICIEPTRDNLASVGTFVLYLPRPYSVCLGSALIPIPPEPVPAFDKTHSDQQKYL